MESAPPAANKPLTVMHMKRVVMRRKNVKYVDTLHAMDRVRRITAIMLN